jgi:hypothetical protein
MFLSPDEMASSVGANLCRLPCTEDGDAVTVPPDAEMATGRSLIMNNVQKVVRLVVVPGSFEAVMPDGAGGGARQKA